MTKLKTKKITLEVLGEIIPLLQEPITHIIEMDFEGKSVDDLISELLTDCPYYSEHFAKLLAILTDQPWEKIHKEVGLDELIDVFQQISRDNNLPTLTKVIKKSLGKVWVKVKKKGQKKKLTSSNGILE